MAATSDVREHTKYNGEPSYTTSGTPPEMTHARGDCLLPRFHKQTPHEASLVHEKRNRAYT